MTFKNAALALSEKLARLSKRHNRPFFHQEPLDGLLPGPVRKEVALLSFAIDCIHESAFLIDQDSRLSYVNNEACRVLGYSREELLTLRLSDVDPDFPEERWSEQWRNLEKIKTRRFESRHRRKDGHIFPVEVDANLFEFNGKKYNLALVRDLTERKRIESELHRREQEIRTLVDNIPDFIVRYDLQGRRTFVNKAWEQASGLSAREVVHKPAESASRMPQPVVAEYRAKIQQVMQDGIPRSHEFSWTNVFGETLDLAYDIVPEFDRTGNIASVLAVGRDVTERNRIESERLSLLKFFEGMDHVNEAILENDTMDAMMAGVLDAVIGTCGCDTAFLATPVETAVDSWAVRMVRTRTGEVEPIDHFYLTGRDFSEMMNALQSTDGPVPFGAKADFPVPACLLEQLRCLSVLAIRLSPSEETPWLFGLGRGSAMPSWSANEGRLFHAIGYRFSAALSIFLTNEKLKESEARYRLVFDNSPVSLLEEDFSGVKELLDDLRSHGVGDLGQYIHEHPEFVQLCAHRLNILEVNRSTLALFEVESIADLKGHRGEYFTSEFLETFAQALLSFWNGAKASEADTIIRTLKGELKNVVLSWRLCYGHERSLSRVIGSFVDITGRKKSEAELRKLFHLVEQSPLSVVVTGTDGAIEYVNPAFSRITGYSFEEVKGCNPRIIKSGEMSAEAYATLWSTITKGQVWQGEFHNKRKNGELFWEAASISPIRSEEGKITHFAAIKEDITEWKKADMALRASLKEKETLLREIHHRVKNNLQVILSMLSLQTTLLKHEEAKRSLLQTTNRIRAMALVHEQMYHSRSYVDIEFSDYLQTISKQLMRVYGRDGIECSVVGARVHLDIDQAIPCALVAHELISNAVRHAFPDHSNGHLVLSLGEESGVITLSVSDDGRGIPEGVNLLTANTMGSTIIQELVLQLEGTLQIKEENGTTVTIVFHR